MSQESDRILYINLFDLLYDACGCDDSWQPFYKVAIKEIETRYDEDTIRRWIEEKD